MINISRRQFISSAAAIAASTQFGVTWARSAAATDQRLIIVFLRGGMDALNFIAPADDKNYLAARPATLRVGTAGAQKGFSIGGIAGGGDLLLHPEASGIAKLWKDKKLALIPAAGLKNGTRSHFQAMDLIERGIADDGGSPPLDGWLTRAALAIGKHEPGSVMSIGGAMPQSLSLCEDALPATEVWDLDWAPSQNFREALFDIHASDNALDGASRQALNATQRLALKVERNAKNEPYLREVPQGVSYPDHEFGRNLNFLAEMLRISPDIGIATADLDGWDMHDNQPDKFGEKVRVLSQSLSAFQTHLEAISRPATIVVMSEFGRRVKANESRGTDHGHGGVMMVLGAGVNGGQNFGTWPGLANEQLDEGADLAVTTDFRDVLATVLKGQGAGAAIAGAFPGHRPKFIDGLMRI